MGNWKIENCSERKESGQNAPMQDLEDIVTLRGLATPGENQNL